MSLFQSGTSEPLLQIDVNLIGSVILFSPQTDDRFAQLSLQEYIQGWLDDVLGRTKLISPLITSVVSSTGIGRLNVVQLPLPSRNTG